MRNTVMFVAIGLAAAFAALTVIPSGAPDAPLEEPASRPAAPRAASAARPAAETLAPTPPAFDTPAELALAESEPEEPSSDTPRHAEDPVEGLVAVGFTPARAAEILRREAELRREAYVHEYAATGTVRPLGSAGRDSGADRLRAELGDDDYERYLEGTGQPRTVVVRAVDTDSAAAHAGLIPGDEIRAYAGQRVFNQRDLNALMLAGTPGEVVATSVVRDGQTLQLYVTRGPLGLM